MTDLPELMTSMMNVQAAGIKAGLQAGDAERERLERERDEALDLLDKIIPGDPLWPAARALLRKHGRVPT